MQVTEDIVVFAPNKTCYNPQMEVGEPYHRKSKNPDGYVAKKNTHGYGLKPVKEISNDGVRYPKNILNISVDYSAQQRVHPTQKPVALMEYLIKSYSNEGETVLDNCMGSGTTGVACVNTNRKFIGIEMDEEYYKIAKQRIESAVPVDEVAQQTSNALVDALY
jgi:site-specific DNA-methyltransferase (adenine-specific)